MLKKYDPNLKFAKEEFVHRERICVNFSEQTIFECNDYWLCKVLGCTKDKTYTANQTDTGYILTFENRMFCGISKMLNIECYQITTPNYVERGVKRFIFLKAVYNFSPGSRNVIEGRSSITFTTCCLQYGFYLKFCDENYVPLVLEDEEYYVDLYLQKSARKLKLE